MDLLTADEVAPLLGVKRARVYERARLRDIPSFKIGKYVRFDRDDIDAYMKETASDADTPLAPDLDARERFQARGGGVVALLKVEDVSARLNMPPRWVYEQVRKGVLPHHKVGKYLRFRPEDIDAFLEATYRPAVADWTYSEWVAWHSRPRQHPLDQSPSRVRRR